MRYQRHRLTSQLAGSLMCFCILATSCGGSDQATGSSPDNTTDTSSTTQIDGSGSETTTVVVGDSEAPPRVMFAPGEELSTRATGGYLPLRPGDSQAMVVKLENLGPTDVDYDLKWSESDYFEGLTVTAATPSTVFVAANSSVEFDVVVEAAAGAEVGAFGNLTLVIEAVVPNRELTTAQVRFDVVDPGTVVGPLIGFDVVLAPSGEVTTVDVVANDGPGDAAVDLSSLQIVGQPSFGVLSVTPDGTVAVDLTGLNVGFGLSSQGLYELCDVNGVCVQAPINIQTF